MNSKIFRRKDGTYTFKEREEGVLNLSVIPAKYSPEDKFAKYRQANS